VRVGEDEGAGARTREHAGKRRGRARELTGGGEWRGRRPRYFWLARATGSLPK
jgi:hypothetical protein